MGSPATAPARSRTSRSSRADLARIEARAQQVASSTRDLVENHAIEADPEAPNALASALAELTEDLRAALEGPVTSDPARAAGVCELLTELTELQQDLREYVIGLRFRALERIHASLSRLREVSTITELLAEAPEELCHSCDFDRAVISRLIGSTWMPEVVCIAAGQDPEVTRATKEFLEGAELPLSPMMLETELARRRAPALVTDPMNDPRTLKALMVASKTPSYVAAPIVSSGRVIGFLHADCFGCGRILTALDRDNLWTFTKGFGLIFERIVLLERLSEQRERVRTAFRSAEKFIEDLSEAEIMLARQQRESGTAVSTAAGLVMPAQSRIQALLTAREREVLSLMVEGARNNEIADQLVISEGTVKSHVKNICRKLRASNRAEAVSKYLQLVMRERS
jgi:DNA-binding CsgD family transcriptional regulator/GAF domain-containing protein